jgi:plasmid stabilization system protein ParE
MIVEWSEQAAAELQAARDFMARSSPGYAQAVAERVVRRSEGLADHPMLGAEVPEYGEEPLREVYEHPLRILYRLTEERVQIVSVVHSARRLPRTPPG